MLLTTCDINVDYKILGMVKGSSMRAVHLGKDILAALRKLVGGTVTEYASLIDEARDEALQKMISEAEKLGANGIIVIRFSTTTITTGSAEIIAYGTAVKI